MNDSVVGSGDVTKAGDTVTDLDIATYNLKVFDGEKDITKDVTISDNGIAELTTESLDKTLIVSYRDIASNDPNQPTDTIKDVDSKIPDKSEDKNTFIDVKTDDIQNVDEDINNGIQLVDTSDNNNVMLYLGLCVGVLFVLVGTIVLRKKEK